ncbi:alpha-lactalbumin-like [Brevipalpus obovatus]|uniref:alpha-lactalbumin-like n=1 Tax=Brevipalpus obovatus TaxID=246614 RepID=UPI003D9E9046
MCYKMFIINSNSSTNKYLIITLIVANIFHLVPVESKEMQRCTLAKTLFHRYKVSRSLIPSLLCYIEKSSKYDTTKITKMDKGNRYGLFQFKGGEHCAEKDDVMADTVCGVPCGSFVDNQITDDVRCWRILHAKFGFSQWDEWVESCKDKFLMGYLQGCPLY